MGPPVLSPSTFSPVKQVFRFDLSRQVSGVTGTYNFNSPWNCSQFCDITMSAMFRTAFTTISCTGLTIMRGFVQLKAETTSTEVSDWPEPLKDKILLEQIFPNET